MDFPVYFIRLLDNVCRYFRHTVVRRAVLKILEEVVSSGMSWYVPEYLPGTPYICENADIKMITKEAVAQLEKNNPIVESTNFFCLWTDFQRDF
ncbi:MAG: hypothetical protein STSR0009_15850 [Methanoregula sp.]